MYFLRNSNTQPYFDQELSEKKKRKLILKLFMNTKIGMADGGDESESTAARASSPEQLKIPPCHITTTDAAQRAVNQV